MQCEIPPLENAAPPPPTSAINGSSIKISQLCWGPIVGISGYRQPRPVPHKDPINPPFHPYSGMAGRTGGGRGKGGKSGGQGGYRYRRPYRGLWLCLGGWSDNRWARVSAETGWVAGRPPGPGPAQPQTPCTRPCRGALPGSVRHHLDTSYHRLASCSSTLFVVFSSEIKLQLRLQLEVNQPLGRWRAS